MFNKRYCCFNIFCLYLNIKFLISVNLSEGRLLSIHKYKSFNLPLLTFCCRRFTGSSTTSLAPCSSFSG